MNKEKILDELRNKKNNLQEKAQENIVIQNIELLGKIELIKKQLLDQEEQENSRLGQLYLVEEYNVKTDEIMIKYYLDDEFIGVNKDGEFLPTGIALESYKDFNSIKDVLENVKIENHDKKDKKKVSNLNQLEKDADKENGENASKHKKQVYEPELNDKKISDIKGKVNLDQQIRGETLRTVLNLGEEYESIAPVSAESIGVDSSSKYCFVAIKNDKTVTVLGEDLLKEDRQKGENPFEKDLKVNNDGELTQESSLSNFRIVNRPNLVISVRHDKNSSTKETTISEISGRESRQEDVAYELHKDGDDQMNTEARNSLRDKKGSYASEELNQRQEEHKEAGCENDRIENIDDDKSNDIHMHLKITEDTKVPGRDGLTVEDWAEELGESTKVIVERLQREIDKNNGRRIDDIVDEIESDYEMVEHKL